MLYRLVCIVVGGIGLPLLLVGCVATSTFEAKEREAAQANRELQAARAAERKLSSELQALHEQRAILERDLGAARGSFGTASQRASDLESELARLQSAVAEKEQETARLRAAVGEKEQEIARLRSTYDDLVRDLKKEIESGEIKVTQYRDLLTVNLVEKILFDSGKAEIKPRGLEILRRVGEILKNVADKQIRIEGHTDNVPIGPGLAVKYATNWELSTARATVVARYFQEKVEIPPQRLAPSGFAEYRPVASNDTPEGRAQNRRIEIILAPVRSGS